MMPLELVWTCFRVLKRFHEPDLNFAFFIKAVCSLDYICAFADCWQAP